MKLLKSETDGCFFFFCPGCGYAHWFSTSGLMPGQKKGEPPKGPVWQFNGDMEKPTVRASILVKGQHVCHSFITNGEIQYLGDCTHELKNKTVEIPEFEW